MNVVEMKIEDLKPYENNPRDNENAVEPVAASIREFGFKIPIVIDSDGVIIAGHTRMKAAQMLGLDKVPCIVADDLTPEQIKAFRLADNKVSEFAEWDFSKLEKELSEIEMDMLQFGFEDEPELPSSDELDAAGIKPDNPITIKITFAKKHDMQKIENDLREYLDGIGGASVVVGGGLGGDYE